jgi:hypothetical protein
MWWIVFGGVSFGCYYLIRIVLLLKHGRRMLEPPESFLFYNQQKERFGGRGWYFWNESWTGFFGPFPSKRYAHEMLNTYVQKELVEE